MKHYEIIDIKDLEGFEIVCSVTHEDIHPGECFDDSEHDIKEICRKIDAGLYDWFMVRVEAFQHGILLGSAYLGGNLYDSAKDFVTHSGGYYEDLIYEAVTAAKSNLKLLQPETI